MDITTQVGNYKLNVRVAVLVRNAQGFLFEKSEQGYYFSVGGRVKAGESSLDAAKREVFEELSVHVDDLSLISIIENFFENKGSSFHELCFVYSSENVFALELPENIVVLREEELEGQDIRPEIIKTIVSETSKGVSHFIVKS